VGDDFINGLLNPNVGGSDGGIDDNDVTLFLYSSFIKILVTCLCVTCEEF
jgi:hypothetical protein